MYVREPVLDREGWQWKYETVGMTGARGAVIVTGLRKDGGKTMEGRGAAARAR